MKNSVFDFSDYKAYLNAHFRSQPARGRGERSRLAEAIQCHTAYVSQVLKHAAHFSLEQAAALSQHLEMDRNESEFFLLLVQHARAGTPLLKRHFAEHLQKARQKRLNLKHRLEFKKALSIEDQATYYSAWYYAAIHVLLSIESMQKREALARRLKLSPQKVSEVLRYLVSVGLAVQNGDRFQIGATSLHLAADSPMVAKHHANWLLRAMAALDDGKTEDLHYSSAVTLAAADLPRVRAVMVKAIEEIRAIVKDSKEDAGYCYLLHLFEV